MSPPAGTFALAPDAAAVVFLLALRLRFEHDRLSI
jgi:hypothetical protein